VIEVRYVFSTREAALNASEYLHLVLFVGYLKSKSGLIKAMNNHDWEEVARLYNGENWEATNPNYATDLKSNYEKHSNQ
jgi:hypothetical protein